MYSGWLIVAACAYFVLLSGVKNVLFDHNDLTNVFELMSEKGQSYLDEQRADINAKHVTENSQQFLVVAVLSDLEIRRSEHWTNLQDIDKTNRLSIHINIKNPECNLQLGTKPVHGEIMCLYLNSIKGLNAMLAVFKEIHSDEFPNVVLYSYYIPCAYVRNVPYSCSEELGKEALENKDMYRMFVGFKVLFPGTDQERAKEFMCRGNIELFQLDQHQLTRLYYLNSPPNRTDIMFQKQLLDCLSGIGVQQCCQNSAIKECQHTCFGEEFLILYIDDLCYNTTKKNGIMRGQLTEYSRGIFMKSVKTYVSQNVDPACGNCRYPHSVTDAIEFCVLDSLAKATYIGAKGLRSLQWEKPPVNIAWDKLYPDSPPGCRFPRAYCRENIAAKCKNEHPLSRFEEINKRRFVEDSRTRFRNIKKERNEKRGNYPV